LFRLYGWADITLADVGAVGTHDPRDRDPVFPGLLVAVFPQPDTMVGWGRVLIQVASGARDEVQLMDGPVTALYADRVDSTGMWGKWSSGGLAHVADGYFCLTRSGSR
jgi:hypothetical protein